MYLLAILLTAILFAAKVFNVLAIGWLVVFSPLLAVAAFAFVIWGLAMVALVLAAFAANA